MTETRKTMLLCTLADVSKLADDISEQYRFEKSVNKDSAAEMLPRLLEAYRIKTEIILALDDVF